MTSATPKRIRCAIYTRVSDDQGLEQDFNIPTRSPQPPFSVSGKPDFAVRDRGRKNGGVDRTSFGREGDRGE
jgi:hypothetical protein